MSVNDGLTYRCGDCGRAPVGKGRRPSINTCPACRGDFTWEVVTTPGTPLSADLPASGPVVDLELGSTGRTTPSDHLGACGHELDRWESHLEHHPECPADSPCSCPEVCAACCRECS